VRNSDDDDDDGDDNNNNNTNPLSLLHSTLASYERAQASLAQHFLFTVLPKLSNYMVRIKYYCFQH
jgi:hypothetical protein